MKRPRVTLTSRLCPITVIPYCRNTSRPPFLSFPLSPRARRTSTPPISLFSLHYRSRWALHILFLRLLLYTRLSGLFYEHCHSLRPKNSSFRAFGCPRHGRRSRVFRCWGRMGRTAFKLHPNGNVACNRSVGTSAREPSKLLRRCGGHRCHICAWAYSRPSRLSLKPRCTFRLAKLPPSRLSSCSVRRKKLRPPRFYTDAVYV